MPLHVILVDDDDMMLRVLEPVLHELETEPRVGTVAAATSPAMGLELLANAPPAQVVFISDYNLRAPMNGIQLLEEVARRRPDAVRILLSGYAADQIGNVRVPAIHGFVEKPMRIREIFPPLEGIIRTSLVSP